MSLPIDKRIEILDRAVDSLKASMVCLPQMPMPWGIIVPMLAQILISVLIHRRDELADELAEEAKRDS